MRRSIDFRKPLFLFVTLLLITVSHTHAEPDAIANPVPSMEEEMVLFQDIPSVFGASKYEQKVSEAPASVTIITREEIRKYGYRTLADILQSQSGFFTTYDRVYRYAGVRGFARPGDLNTRILLLVDGHRINDGIFDQALIGTEFPVDIDLIDRVEVIRGPSSSIYGSNAFFGVINVITRRGRDLKGTEISGEAGSYHTYKGRLSYGNKFQNGLEAVLSGTWYGSSGHDLYFREFDSPDTNHGIAHDLDEDEFYNFFTRLSYGDFSLEGVFHTREKGIPTAPAGYLFNDPSTAARDERAYFDLKYDHTFENQLGLSAHVYYDHYSYEGTYPYFTVIPDIVGPPARRLLYDDLADSEWVGADVQLTKRLLEKHKLILGAEFRDYFVQDQDGYVEAPYVELSRSHMDSKNWAIYAQDEFQIVDNLILNAGVRYDEYEMFGGTANPRLALIYTPFHKTTMKALYGRAFRAPNAYEIHLSEEELQPETIDTYELVLEQQIKDHIRMRASGFYYEVEDLITLQRDRLLFRNVDELEAAGFEIEMEGKWPNGVEGFISYSFQDTKDKFTGDRLTNSPQHMAKMGVIVPLIKDRLFASANMQYIDSRLALPRERPGGKTIQNEADDYILANFTLYSQHFLKRLEVSASIYNLFDEDYGDPGSQEHFQELIGRDGRTFRVKLTYSF